MTTTQTNISENGWNPDTFSFSHDFQKQIIAAMIQEPKIFETIGILTDYKYFELRDLSEIFKNLQEFFNKYKGLPSKEALFEQLIQYYRSETLNESLEELYTYPKIASSTLSYIEENVRNFIQCQAIKKAIIDSLDDLGDINKHYNVKNRIEDALTVGSSLDDFGINAYDDDEILNRWKKRKENTDVPRISTGWNKFDQIFGGYGVGELFSYTGPAHSGKSMYLVNAGANTLLQKKNVLHITLEMSEEITSQRYDMRLLNLNKEDLKTHKATKKLKDLLEKRIGQLVIKRWPSLSITATDIVSFMKRLENVKQFKPDILIVDYAELMRSTYRYNDKRFELDTIYQQLRNIGIEFNIPVVTATQLNRGALEKLEAGKILTEESIAESYGIARIIDCGVTINATPAENAKNNSVIYVYKNRDGESGEQFRMYVDFSRALVREWTASPDIREIPKNRR